MTEQSSDKTQKVFGKIQDTLRDVAGRVVSVVSTAESSAAEPFVQNAAIGDLYEIEAAQIALRRSSSPGVREHAEKVLADHTTSTHQLQAALEMNETRGVAVAPRELDMRHKELLRQLEGAPTERFDTTYLDQEVIAHEETLKRMKKYRADGDNPQLRSFAAATVPVLERHLRHAQALRGLSG